ncbi:MAG: DUF3291 domain-containing protein [Pseudomonadota bacterium]
MTGKHLAQLNVGRLVAPPGDPRVAEFIDNLDRVNAAAERMEGFVWRLQTGAGNAIDLRFAGDPRTLMNVSVWESADALQAYVFQTIHAQFYRKRANWFQPMDKPHFVMWWIPAGHRPTIAEAAERLTDLQDNGPSERAFGWADLPNADVWRSARCA